MCQVAARPAEGGPAEAGGLLASFAMEHCPSGTDARQFNICPCLQPDKSWHKVKSPKADYNGV